MMDQMLVRQIQDLGRRLGRTETLETGVSNVMATYLALPQLRGFWPMSSVDENGDAYDFSHQGRTLTNNNTATFAATDFLPYAQCASASSQYFSRADEAGLDITGGVTMGCWVYFDSNTGSNMFIMGKREASTAAYSIRRNTGNDLITAAINTGPETTSISATAVSNGQWYFIAMRYTPSTELSVWLNDDRQVNTTSIPASISNSSAYFMLMARDNGASVGTLFTDGRIALPFVCANNLSNAKVANLYQQSRVLFGV